MFRKAEGWKCGGMLLLACGLNCENCKARICECKLSACTVLSNADVCCAFDASESEHGSSVRPKGGRATWGGWVGYNYSAIANIDRMF